MSRLRNAGLIEKNITIPAVPRSPPASLVGDDDDDVEEEPRAPEQIGTEEEFYVKDMDMSAIADLYE